MKDSGRYWELPADSYPELQQGVAIAGGFEAQGRPQRPFWSTFFPQKARRCLSNTVFAYRKQMIVQALTLTLRLAIVVSAILLVIGVPLAYWLAFSRRRWKFLVEAIVSLPIVLPPTVLGFYVLVAVGPLSPVGRWYQALTGHSSGVHL